MKIISKCVLITFIVLSVGISSRGQGNISGSNNIDVDGRSHIINTAVPFLRIAPDARSGAMGDVGIALSPDANAAYWNLSKLNFAETEGGLAFNYNPWLTDIVDDIFLAYVSGFKRLDDIQTMGASLRYFDLGNIQFTNLLGEDEGLFHPREFSFDVGYTRKLSEDLSLGLALRYIYSNLASGTSDGSTTFKPGHGVSGDLSAFYTHTKRLSQSRMDEKSRTWNFGVTLTNLGSKISYSNDSKLKNFIPSNLGLGGAYTYQFNQYNKITLALDINKLLVPTPDSLDRDGNGILDYREKSVLGGIFSSFHDAPGGFREELRELTYSLGAEYWYNDLVALRAGYFDEHKSKGDRKYLTLGLGIKYQNKYNFNFSYLVPSGRGPQRSPLSNTIRFSFLIDLGDPMETNGFNRF